MHNCLSLFPGWENGSHGKGAYCVSLSTETKERQREENKINHPILDLLPGDKRWKQENKIAERLWDNLPSVQKRKRQRDHVSS